MKYCPVEAYRYSDEVAKCVICGTALVDSSLLNDLPDNVRRVVATSCCPNVSCPNNIAAPKTNFCSLCGTELVPISYGAWVRKYVEPALDGSLATVLLKPSTLFRPISEMGLSRSQAHEILNSLIEERIGTNIDVAKKWIQQAELLLKQDDKCDENLKCLREQADELSSYSAIAGSLIDHLTGTSRSGDSTPFTAVNNTEQSSVEASFTNNAADELLPASEMETGDWELPFCSNQPPAPQRGASFPIWLLVALILLVGIPASLAMASLFFRTEEKDDTFNERPLPTPIPSPPEMVLINGATFMMGTDDGDDYERPRHSVSVSSFYIDVHEVTNEQYAQFVKETGYMSPGSWGGDKPPSELAKLPITGIDWYAANAYAQWKKKRLPTEQEWELAARTQRSWKYPWGNEW
jgi:hypothetical protein